LSLIQRLLSGRRPKIARQAANEPLAAIINLDELLAALIAVLLFFGVGRRGHLLPFAFTSFVSAVLRR
jgi:hypothetical protein